MTNCSENGGLKVVPPEVPFSRGLALFLLATIGMAPSSHAGAGELKIKPSLTQRIEQNNNALLSARPNSVLGSVTSPMLDVRLNSQTTALAVQGRTDIARHLDDPALDSTNYQLSSQFQHHTQRNQFKLDTGFGEQATSATEIADTGRLKSGVSQSSLSLVPSWLYQVGQRNRLSVTANHVQIDYNDPDFIGHTRSVLTPAFEHRLSERDSVQASALYDRFESANGLQESDGYGGELGYRRDLTQRLALRAGAGLRWTETTSRKQPPDQASGPGQRQNGTDWLASIALAYRTLTGDYEIAYTHSLDPTSTGNLRARDDWRLTAAERLTERTAFSLTTRYLEQAAASTVRDDSRRFLEIAPKISYAISNQIEINSLFRRRWQMFGYEEAGHASDALLVTLIWQPLPWSMGF